MSTIQQDMTDAAAVWERLAKRLAEAHGDDSEEMWDQATQIHAAATIIRAWVDKHKAKLRAAVDEDAPRRECVCYEDGACSLSQLDCNLSASVRPRCAFYE